MVLLGSGATPTATRDQLKTQTNQLETLLPNTPQRAAQIEHLQGSHGLQAVPLIEAAAPEKRAPLSDVIPLCEAEISHAIQAEHARRSTDVLARRCRLAMVDFAEAQRLEPLVETYLAQSGLVSGATSTSPMSHQLNP